MHKKKRHLKVVRGTGEQLSQEEQERQQAIARHPLSYRKRPKLKLVD